MPVVTKDNSSNPFNVDEGVYKATVASVEEAVGKKGPYLIWQFKIHDPVLEGEPSEEVVTLRGNCPNALRDDTKLDKWLKACGIVVSDGDTVDTDDAEGEEVQVMVENREVNGRMYSNVVKVAPARKKSSAKTTVKKTAEPKKAAEPKKVTKSKKAADPEPEEETIDDAIDENSGEDGGSEDIFDFD